MNDTTAITSALTSLKTAAEMAKAFLGLKTTVEVQAKVFELQRVILAAQQEAFSAQQTQAMLLQEKRELEERIRSLETWNREKERYALAKLSHGVFAYALKPDAKSADPPHHICANCYQNGRKSILQSDGLPNAFGGPETLKCPQCKCEIIIPHEGTKTIDGLDWGVV